MLHKLFSISLSFLVLFSTVSFTVEKHYCGKTLVDVAVFSEVTKCCEKSKKPAEVRTKDSCCSDEVDVIKGQDELKVTPFDDLDFEQQQFITAYIFTSLGRFKSLPRQIIPNRGYLPPNLVADIQVLDQVFII